MKLIIQLLAIICFLVLAIIGCYEKDWNFGADGKTKGLHIDDNGDVGIGIASPAYLLQTSGGDVTFNYAQNGVSYFDMYNTEATEWVP